MNHGSRHHFVHRIAAAFLAALFAAPPSHAAGTNKESVTVRLAIGSRARMHIASGNAKASAVMGKVTAIDEASVTVETPGGALVRVPRAEIRSLQVSLQQRRRIKKGALIVKTTTWIPVSVNGPNAGESRSGSDDLTVRLSPIIGRGRGAGMRLQVGW